MFNLLKEKGLNLTRLAHIRLAGVTAAFAFSSDRSAFSSAFRVSSLRSVSLARSANVMPAPRSGIRGCGGG